jgi:hypothetical protein
MMEDSEMDELSEKPSSSPRSPGLASTSGSVSVPSSYSSVHAPSSSSAAACSWKASSGGILLVVPKAVSLSKSEMSVAVDIEVLGAWCILTLFWLGCLT